MSRHSLVIGSCTVEIGLNQKIQIWSPLLKYEPNFFKKIWNSNKSSLYWQCQQDNQDSFSKLHYFAKTLIWTRWNHFLYLFLKMTSTFCISNNFKHLSQFTSLTFMYPLGVYIYLWGRRLGVHLPTVPPKKETPGKRNSKPHLPLEYTSEYSSPRKIWKGSP